MALDRIRARLPEDADPPNVYKLDLASIPVAFMGVTGAGDPRLLKFLAEDELSRALERVPGVASVTADGGRDREIHVSLDSARLAAPNFVTRSETMAEIDRLLLVTRIEAAVATEPRTSHLEIAAQVNDHHLKLIGPWLEDAQRDLVLDIARPFAGDRSLEYVTGYEPVMEIPVKVE